MTLRKVVEANEESTEVEAQDAPHHVDLQQRRHEYSEGEDGWQETINLLISLSRSSLPR